MASIFLTVFIGTSPFGFAFRSFWHYNNTGIAKSKIPKILELLYHFNIEKRKKKGRHPFGCPPNCYEVQALTVVLRLRKKPPAMHTITATPATMALPSRPETEVPAALSLVAKA